MRSSGGAGRSTSAPRSPTGPCGPTSWASAVRATRRRGHRTSRRCGPSCSTRCGPGHWGSRPRARWGTAPSTASSCRAPMPPRTSSSASARPWARPAPASSSWPRWARRARCSRTLAKEVDWMRRLSAATGRPVSYVLLQQDDDPELWRQELAASLDACAEGAQLFPQIAGRPTGILSGHHTTLCLFADFPAYRELRGRGLSAAELGAALADPEVRRAIVAWTPSSPAEADGHGEGVPAHLRARRPARLRAGPGALAGGHRRRARGVAAGGGLRRDGPRRRPGAALPPHPQLRHGRPRPRARP